VSFVGGDEAAQLASELLDVGEDATGEGSSRKLSEPGLDGVEPGGAGGGEVQVEARMYGRTIRLCPGAVEEGTCGPLGCTLIHEMTHQEGHSGETVPRFAEKCLGCP
jgi:hypothetical protein